MIRFFLLTLLLTALHATAQTKETPHSLNVKFRALSVDGAILGAGYLEGRNLKRLDISADALTAEQSYIGPNPLQFFEQKGSTAADQKIARQAKLDIQARMQTLVEELKSIQARSKNSKSESEGGGGRRLASTSGPYGGGGEADEIIRELEVLNQRLLRIESEINRVTVPALAPPESPGKPRSTEEIPGNEPDQVQPFASFNFPADGSYILLIHRTATGTVIKSLDDQEGSFPYGAIQFVNLTGVYVEVRLGTKTLALLAKDKGVLIPSAAHNTYFAGEIYARGKDGLQLAYSMRLFQQNDVRTLYFLLPAEDGGHGVKPKGVEERRAPEPPPNAPKDNPATTSG
jgi:hypothetical protein